MIYQFGECTFDTSAYSVQRGGQRIRLRPKVFRVCRYLVEHRDRVVSRDELCAQMWPGRCVSPATLEGVIRSVRQSLGDSGRAQDIILTRRSYGYRFVAGVEEWPIVGAAGSAGQSSARVAVPEVADRGQTDVEGPSVVLAEEPEVMPNASGVGIANQRTSGQNRDSVDSQAAIVPKEQRLGHQRSLAEQPVVRVGLALVLVTLMLLGAWGIWWEISAPAAGSLDKSRIAVLPFIDLSARATPAYFADGLTQELIAQLAQIHGLTVIARTSVMQYKDTLKDVATVGRELRVGTVLEGSVRTVDKQVRINVQLIDVVSEGHVWSQEYDRELTEVFSIQRDIAARVADRLRVPLTGVQEQRADLRPQDQAAFVGRTEH
jgi:TolB-like protein/DNA-binding winged helix-turn-helix (wHTH) protein